MKILYGIQTTGNGHIIRGREMITALRKRGHEVETILSGDTNKKIIDKEIFEPAQIKEGLSFVTENGKVKYLKTFKELNFVKFITDIYSYKPKDIDLIITDYEPITARIAKRYNIPSIGISHLYSFCHDVPLHESGVIGKFVIKQFAPVKIPLGLHWHHFNQPILPPTIPPDIKPSKKAKKDKILVYLPFEDKEKTKDMLKEIKGYQFYVYCNLENKIDEENIHLRPFSRKGFVKDLSECDGLISNSGFSLISEALHLGKKIIAKPVAGQTEQESNALALKQLKLGTVIKELNVESIKEWLTTDSPPPMNFPYAIEPLADWITKGKWEDYETLIKNIWKTKKQQ
ncbi:MAG: MJ1255/VC2487 family glycosyltransferase [Nanobdellota archaeon]